MPYYNVKDFQRGLDTRRMVETTEAGSLIKGRNLVITRGGEIERRKAFVPVLALPPGTHGMYVDDSKNFHVWHTVATPAPVARVVYHKLTHPQGLALERIRCVRWFNTKFFVVAMFEDKKNLSFYGEDKDTGEGVLVTDALPPIVIDPNGGGETTDPGGGIDETAIVQLTGVWNNGDTVTIDITAGVVPVAYSATVGVLVDGSTSAEVAAAFAEPQHLGSVPGITVTFDGSGKVIMTPDPGNIVTVVSVTETILNPEDPIVVDPPAIGQGRATAVIEITKTSDLASNLPVIVVQAPAPSASIWIIGTDVAVAEGDSAETVAQSVADTINTHFPVVTDPISPNFVATATGAKVYISYEDPGPEGNTSTFLMSLGFPSVIEWLPKPAFFLNGRNEDDNTVVIDGRASTQAVDRLFSPGRYALQHRYKMFAVGSDGVLRASALNNPLYWNPAYTGAGAIDFTQSGGTHDSNLQSLAIFQDKLAVIAANAVHIWNMDPDLAASNEVAILHNTGTFAQRSVAEYGNTDVFYLDQSGVRSLQSRDITGEAFASDVGNPIDDLVREAIQKLVPGQGYIPVAEIEPGDGRYVLFIGHVAFVFSFFSKTKIAAWSIWETDFDVSELAINSARMYARSLDQIYSYGQEGATTIDEDYDDCPIEVQLPYLHAEKPATQKDIFGMDVAVQNTWNVEFGIDYSNVDQMDQAGIVSGTTFRFQRLPIQTYSTHISFKLTCNEPGYARLGSLVFHYREGEEPG
jgi:hypothetical protein